MLRAGALALLLSCCSGAWVQQRRARADERVEVMFGVRQQHVPELEASLYAVSDPTSPRYGAHLSQAQVDALVAPSAAATAAVGAFLLEHNVTAVERSGSGDWVRFTATVGALEAMSTTAAEYHHYAHGASRKRTALRCASFALPPRVARYVDVVSPSTRFPPRARFHASGTVVARAAATSGGTSGDGWVSPALIRSQYAVGSFRGSAKGNSQAAAGFWWQEGQIDAKDTRQFWMSQDPKELGTPFTIFGNETWPQHHYDPGAYGAEGALDAQYLSTSGASVPTTYMYFDGFAPGSEYEGVEPWLAFLYHGWATSPARRWSSRPRTARTRPTRTRRSWTGWASSS